MGRTPKGAMMLYWIGIGIAIVWFITIVWLVYKQITYESVEIEGKTNHG